MGITRQKEKKVNYRKICQDHYGYTDEQMKGMDVHHIDGNRYNNKPENLKLLSPEEHAKIHESDFVLWARKGAKIGNSVFKKRLKELGPTEKEKEYYEKLRNQLKEIPLHLGHNHSEKTKIKISESKKGSTHSEETKIKIGKSNKGKKKGVKLSKETIKKIRETKKERYDKTKHSKWGTGPMFELISPDGEVFLVKEGFDQWCKDRKLSSSNLRTIAFGKSGRKQHKGWKAKIAKEN
jgi:hypothetical protein